MSDELGADGFVTGPHRVDNPPPNLADALADLWGRVIVAGGAIGFKPTDPVDAVRETAGAVLDDVTQRRAYMMTLGQGHVLVGAALLVPGELPVHRHVGKLAWLMVDPGLRDSGWAQQLHDAVLAQAQALGLEKLCVYVPGGRESEGLYADNGWTECGRWPGAVRVAEGDDRDQVWYAREVPTG